MTWLECAAVLLAGAAAGGINTLVGSGTLITFPVLLAFGVPPVTANMSNAIGLVPGSVAGAIGYRRELTGQRDRIIRLSVGSMIGALAGALLLLVLPPEAFEAIVPALIGLGVVLVVAGPRISAWVRRRHGDDHLPDRWWVWPAVLGTGIYCGYFGAAQGVILMAVLGIGVQESLQRLNGVKNILAAVGNGVAGLVFVAVAFDEIDWLVVALVAVGAVLGAQVGAGIGRRLPDSVLRAVIVVVGLTALAAFLLR